MGLVVAVQADIVAFVEFLRIPGGVGWTSLTTLSQRALESAKPDALFTDPLAAAVMEALPEATRSELAEQAGKENDGTLAFLRGYTAIRTNYLDRALMETTSAGIKQVVILGTGLDGRGYRLPWPAGTHVYELDFADVIGYKRDVARQAGLVETAALTAVAADLREDWARTLLSTGFDPDSPAIWLAEGVLNYLPESAADGLLAKISSLSSSCSRLMVTYLDPTAEAALANIASTSGDGSAGRVALLRDAGPPAAPQEWLSGYGWKPHVDTVEAWAQRLQRDCPPVLDTAYGGGTGWLVTANCVAPGRGGPA